MSKGSGALRLAEVNQQLSETETTQADIVGWQTSLQAAMFSSISAEDVAEIVKSQVAKAKKGDANALKFVMGHVLGTTRPVSIKQTLVVTDVESAARMAKEANSGRSA